MRLPRSRALDEEVDEMRRCWGQRKKKMWSPFPELCVSSLRRGHAVELRRTVGPMVSVTMSAVISLCDFER